MQAKTVANMRCCLFFFYLIFVLAGCATIYHKDQLTLANQIFDQKNIGFKTDGYYYKIQEFNNLGVKEISFSPLIFYVDGYVRVCNFRYGSSKNNQTRIDSLLKRFQDEIEKSIIDSSFHVQLKNNIWDWGLYSQEEAGQLTIQCYHNVQGDYVLNLYDANVLNDTTIIIQDVKELPSPWTGENKEFVKGGNDIYHFKRFYLKPDSTNYIRQHIHEFGKNRKKHSNFNPNKK